MATGKRIYNTLVHGVLGFADLEGGGPRLRYDAPRIAARLKDHPLVRDVAIVAFYGRGARNSLYAFVEAEPDLSEGALRNFVARSETDVEPPECIQLTHDLPRRSDGEIRVEVLQLVASNQLDQVDHLLANDSERAIVGRIIANRLNLADRF
jgi:hypothetical protein